MRFKSMYLQTNKHNHFKEIEVKSLEILTENNTYTNFEFRHKAHILAPHVTLTG